MDSSPAAAAATFARMAEEIKNSAPRPQPAINPKSNSQKTPSAAPADPDLYQIRDGLIPAMLQLAAGAQNQIDGKAFLKYRDALVWEAKSQDILEQTLLEQVALAHLSSFRLLGTAGVAKTAEESGIYSTAAAKLMGEVRRTIVAIKELRSPPSSPSITVATTQQVNVNGNTGNEAPTRTTKKSNAQSEVRSNNGTGANRMQEILGEDLGGAEEPTVVGAAE